MECVVHAVHKCTCALSIQLYFMVIELYVEEQVFVQKIPYVNQRCLYTPSPH